MFYEKLKLDSSLKGRILDIGGGGEGIIGQIYRQQVIAIDNSQEELDEAPDVCRKMLMDTTIPNAYPIPFTVSLDIDANGTIVHTTYGIVKTDVQNIELFVSMCQEAGMTLLKKVINNTQIYLQFSKTAQ